MEIRGLRDIQDITTNLITRDLDLMDVLVEKHDYVETAEDARFLNRVFEILSAYRDVMTYAEFCFNMTIRDIETDEEITADNSHKVMFILQKYHNGYIKVLAEYIEGIIIDIRKDEVDDYRVRDYQMDVARKMEMIRCYYKKRYDV